MILAALLIAVLWAIPSSSLKYLISQTSLETVVVVDAVAYITIATLFLLWNRKKVTTNIKLWTPKLYALSFAVMTAAFLGNVLFLYLIRKHESYVVLALTATYPVFALLFGYFLWQEKVSVYSVVGVFLIITGVCMLYLHGKQ